MGNILKKKLQEKKMNTLTTRISKINIVKQMY